MYMDITWVSFMASSSRLRGPARPGAGGGWRYIGGPGCNWNQSNVKPRNSQFESNKIYFITLWTLTKAMDYRQNSQQRKHLAFREENNYSTPEHIIGAEQNKKQRIFTCTGRIDQTNIAMHGLH